MRLRHLVPLAVFLALAACGGDKATDPYTNTNQSNGATGPTGGGSTSNSISIVDYGFTPGSTSIAVGTTVTWNWNGQATHNVTFDDPSVTGSGDMGSGGSFSKVFNTPGTYTYQCTNHYGMTGTISVHP